MLWHCKVLYLIVKFTLIQCMSVGGFLLMAISNKQYPRHVRTISAQATISPIATQLLVQSLSRHYYHKLLQNELNVLCKFV